MSGLDPPLVGQNAEAPAPELLSAAPGQAAEVPVPELLNAPPAGAPVAFVQDWYFQEPRTQQPTGPWSVAQLRVRWQRHRIDGLTMVWKTGFDKWAPLRDVAELTQELREAEAEPAEEGDGVALSRGLKRKRRMPLDALPLTYTYTSNKGVLLVYDAVDNDWKPDKIYEDLVTEETRPEPDPGAQTVEAGAAVKPTPAGDDELTPEAQEALKELLGDVAHGSAILGSGGTGATLLGLGEAGKSIAKAKAQADAAAEKAAAAPPLSEEQQAKANKRREYRERKKLKRQAGLFIKAHENRNVYVSGLPTDVTLLELEPVFKRGGILKVDVDTGESKIRIYRDSEGKCKGDALVSYANAESVELAVRFLHEFQLRSDCRIAVQVADFEDKEEAPKLSKEELKEIASKRNVKDERKRYRAAKNAEKEAVSWSGDMDDGSGRKIIILKHMFSLEEAEKEGPEFYPELADEVKEECEKIGQVVRVTPIQRHPHGLVSVKFRSSSEAEECIRVMDGRFFGGQTVEASFYDGKTDLMALVRPEAKTDRKAPSRFEAQPQPVVNAATTVAHAPAAPVAGDGEETTATQRPEAVEVEAPETDEKKTDKSYDEWLGGNDSDSDSDSDLQIRTEE